MQSGGPASAALCVALAGKVSILCAIALVRHSTLWRKQLSAHLVSGAPPGARCLMFWPPPSMDLMDELQHEGSSVATGAGGAQNPRKSAWMLYLAHAAERGLLAVQVQAELALATVYADGQPPAPGTASGTTPTTAPLY